MPNSLMSLMPSQPSCENTYNIQCVVFRRATIPHKPHPTRVLGFDEAQQVEGFAHIVFPEIQPPNKKSDR